MKKNQEKAKKNRKIAAYGGFTIRILVGIFALAIAFLFFLEMTRDAATRISFALCFLIPVFALVVVVGDIYLRYKMDIKPLKKQKKDV